MLKLKMYIAFGFLTFLTSCSNHQNPVSVNESTYQIEYKFINHGDSLIDAVEIHSETYYPKNDNYDFQMKNWKSVGPYDSLTNDADVAGYDGCVTQISVFVLKHWQNGLYDFRVFTLPADTLRNINDKIREFNWPLDTLKSTSYYW